tara:strand:- start:389 stop:922 length:534 start_codon:yes stop_codon:yes gene_type:complete
MKQLLTLITLTIFLGACASTSPYRPAKGDTGMGYRDQKLSDDRWRVEFQMRNSNRSKAMDYALMRSAELTLQKGFDWFEVVDRVTEVDRGDGGGGSGVSVSQSRGYERNCGLLGCTTRPSTATQVGVGIGTGSDSRSKVTSIVEIVLGKGVRPESRNIYDARELADSLHERLINEKQ